jgi:mannose-6-phosphate isomerase-like protein (cupin superfamily)
MAGFHVTRDEGDAIAMLGERLAVKAAAAATAGAYTLIEDQVVPGGGPPPHMHASEDEAFFMLDGALRVMCGDEIFQVEPGGFVYLPRRIPHTYSVVGNTPARFLALFSPGGIEKFFAELGVPASSVHPEPQTAPDIDRVVRIAAKYGVTLVSPDDAP